MLTPWPQPFLGGVALVWLTDLAVPDRAALGLESVTLTCDRTACRYVVKDTSTCVPWLQWAARLPLRLRSLLETEGRKPAHWYISEQAVLAELSQSDPMRKG
jgi:hypothetical protein